MADQQTDPLNTRAHSQRLTAKESIRLYQDQLKREAIIDRVSSSDRRFHDTMKNVQEFMSKKAGKGTLTGEQIYVGAQQAMADRPLTNAPNEISTFYEDDIAATDIRDVISALLSVPGEKPITLAQASEREHNIDPDILKLLRQEREYEKRHGHDPEGGSLLKRAADWRATDEGQSAITKEGVLKGYKYALMAGVIVGTSGAAIPAMVTAKVIRKIQPNIVEGLTAFKGKLSNWLVNNEVMSQEQLDKIDQKVEDVASKVKDQPFWKTKTGKAVTLISGAALMGGACFALGDTFGIDGIADKFTGEQPPGEPVPTPGEPALTDAAVDAVNEPPESQSISKEGLASALDVADYSPGGESGFAHPNGGLDRDALVEKLESRGSAGAMEAKLIGALQDMPAQI